MKNDLPNNYDPLLDQTYMSQNMIQYFEIKLNKILREILAKENEISHSMMDNPDNNQADHVDRGITEELNYQNFMFQEHEEGLRQEVEEALERINNGKYGYCEETGNPIGVKRLMSVPTAKYIVDVQEEIEASKTE